MTLEEKLVAALEPLGLPVEPGLDTLAEGEYLVYSYSREGTLPGDDAPCLEARRWMLIYAAPLNCNRQAMCKRIRKILADLFDAWVSEEWLADQNGQRWLYEFDTIGGIDDGPDGG